MICFVAFIAVAVFVAFVSVGFAGQMFSGLADPTPEENAARIFPQLFDHWRLPSGHHATLVHGEVPPTFTGSSTRWFQMSVPPQDVPEIERSLGRSLRSVSKLPVTESRTPRWWHPETLADAQIYSTEGRHTGQFYVTSRSSGTIYYYFQGH